MESAAILTRVVCCCFFVVVSVNGRVFERDDDIPNCPTVMCATPCPVGTYLTLNEDGCETCDCYDPCEKFECEVGQCHWMLDETARPVPFCVECRGGQAWSDCTGGSDCVATCANTTPKCNRNCYPGCQCPKDKPVLHHGKCIADYECRDACEGGQEWTECGMEVAPTCRNLYPENAQPTCVSRCQCPRDRPIWDADRSLCVNKSQCLHQYYMEKPVSGNDEDDDGFFNEINFD